MALLKRFLVGTVMVFLSLIVIKQVAMRVPAVGALIS